MIGGYGVSDFLRAAQKRRDEVRTELAWIAEETDKHHQRLREVEVRAAAARDDLVGALLPSLSAEVLAAAARLTGCTMLVTDDFMRRRAEDEANLRRIATAIEADERYRRREILRAPRVGTLTRAVAELEEFRAPFSDIVERGEHPRLQRLLDSNYGTDKYDTPWWRTAYYADWRAGDEIVERFPGKDDFAAVRAELASAIDNLAVYDQRLSEIRAEIAAGEELERDHDAALAALPTLDERWLARARERLAAFLEDIDLPSLGERLAGAADLVLLAQRFAGLREKGRYLEGLHEARVATPAGGLREELSRLERDIAKYSRPKKAGVRFPADKFDRRFRDRGAAFRKHQDRYLRTYDTVYVFDRWDRGRLAEDFLWWDVMTDGRLDGDFIPEVSDFHRHNPGYRYEHHEAFDDRDAAAAVAEGGVSEYSTGGFDPS